MNNAEGPDEIVFKFGPYQLMPRRRLLLKDGAPLSLGGRAMDLLHALVEQAGAVLSREELEARVWPRSVVEETSLRVHISLLRRSLQDGCGGARYITNVPGRGYCFVAEVARTAVPVPPSGPNEVADPPAGRALALGGAEPVRLDRVQRGLGGVPVCLLGVCAAGAGSGVELPAAVQELLDGGGLGADAADALSRLLGKHGFLLVLGRPEQAYRLAPS